tara:strand:+ start:514 stop:1458 length:945 start_codon:yes stop_codon:yes gene_type:complete
MCGIVAYIGKNTPINKLMYLMHDNDSRGGHSTGAYVNNKLYKTVNESGNLLSMIDEHESNLFIGHTRYATHGVKTAENTHPYVTGKYIGCHNGVLSNYEEVLKDNHQGPVDVDSKAIYSMLDSTDDYSTLGQFAGTINAVWTENNGQLYVYRRNNPLFRLRTEDGIYFSSLKEGLITIAGDAKKVKEVTKDKVFIYSPTGELIESIEIPVTAIEKVASKNWYEYGDYTSPNSTRYTKEEISEWKIIDAKLDREEELVQETYDDYYSDEWIAKMDKGIIAFEKVYDELKYHGYVKKEEIEDIDYVLETIKDTTYC